MGNSASSSSKTNNAIELNSLTSGPINNLSLEVLANIFRYLPVKDQHEFAQTSKRNLTVLLYFSWLRISGLTKSEDKLVMRALLSNPNIKQMIQNQETTVPLLTLAKEHRKLLKHKNLDFTKIGPQKTLQVYTPQFFPLIQFADDHKVFALIKLGNLMASIAQGDNHIKIWNPKIGTLVQTLEEDYPRTLQALPATANGEVLLLSNGFRLKIWNPSTGALIRWLHGPRGIVGEVQVLHPGSDGKVLLAINRLCDINIMIWDFQTDTLIRTLSGHTNWVTTLHVLSPETADGKLLLASGSADHNIKIWDPHTGALVHTLQGHGKSVTALERLPPKTADSKALLASSSLDMTIKIWNPHTGALIDTLHGHTGSVEALQVLPSGLQDEMLLASGSDDSTIKIWNAGTGECLHTIAVDKPVCSMMYDAGVLRAGLSNGRIVSIPCKGIDLDALLGPDTSANKKAMKKQN